MTTAVLTNLPFQAGGAVASAAGRAVLWGLQRYMREPLRNTAVLALVSFSTMAGANALYHQAHRHPAPLFGVVDGQPAPSVADENIVPAPAPVRHKVADIPLVTDTPAPAAAAVAKVTSADVFEVQRRLKAFNLFDATVDGLFGARTSRAIKAFEQRVGRTPKGELTREIVDLILATPITAEAPVVAPLPTPDPLPAQNTTSSEPLPAPEPLNSTITKMQPVAEASAPAPTATTAVASTTPVEAATELAVADTAESAPVETAALPLAATTGSVTKRVVQTVAIAPPGTAAEKTMPPLLDTATASTDPTIVARVQRGLASLGFLRGDIDGVAGEATSKAIRNFEVYYNYAVTGRITAGLINVLIENGADIGA